ncbi:MAG: hypothetical protein GXO64_03070 [Candidatus Micrarchaeota archaeon]|nr:hypothetical protein [Candidatus Micrarchaeota archaeon]
MAKVLGKYRFVTNRVVSNKAGEGTGRVKAYVPVDSDIVHIEYKCPECGFSEKTEQEWKRPFNVKCSNCGYLMRIARLKDQIKKEKKKAKAKKK